MHRLLANLLNLGFCRTPEVDKEYSLAAFDLFVVEQLIDFIDLQDDVGRCHHAIIFLSLKFGLCRKGWKWTELCTIRIEEWRWLLASRIAADFRTLFGIFVVVFPRPFCCFQFPLRLLPFLSTGFVLLFLGFFDVVCDRGTPTVTSLN